MNVPSWQVVAGPQHDKCHSGIQSSCHLYIWLVLNVNVNCECTQLDLCRHAKCHKCYSGLQLSCHSVGLDARYLSLFGLIFMYFSDSCHLVRNASTLRLFRYFCISQIADIPIFVYFSDLYYLVSR